jgi:hypothetical protein
LGEVEGGAGEKVKHGVSDGGNDGEGAALDSSSELDAEEESVEKKRGMEADGLRERGGGLGGDSPTAGGGDWLARASRRAEKRLRLAKLSHKTPLARVEAA